MPPKDNLDEDVGFEELVGDEGNLKGVKPEDVQDEKDIVEEPSSDAGETAADAEPVTATEPKAEEPEPEKVDEPPKKTPYQERIDELTRKRYEAERESARLRERLQQVEGKKPEQKPPQPEKGQPKPEDFDTYDEYYVALADHRADQKIKQWRDEEQRSRQVAFITQKQAEFREKLKKGGESYSDFNEVVFDPAAPISRNMVEICQDIEKPSEVLYYLAKNHAEARKITLMHPLQAARAIGKIEAELVANSKTNPKPPTKTITSAPAPIKPVSASTSATTKDPAKMSHEEYRAWRRAGGGK